jgi:hypothetical protein
MSLRSYANLSYGNDECLVLSIDSANRNAADCYRIIPVRNEFRLDRASQIISAARGTDHLAITVSQPFEAIAWVSKKGIVQVRPYGKLHGNLGEHRSVDSYERTSLAFDGTGRKLLYIDEKVLDFEN